MYCCSWFWFSNARPLWIQLDLLTTHLGQRITNVGHFNVFAFLVIAANFEY